MAKSVQLRRSRKRHARTNLRELTEMAAAISAQTSSAERIQRQEELLAKLLKDREALEQRAVPSPRVGKRFPFAGVTARLASERIGDNRPCSPHSC